MKWNAYNDANAVRKRVQYIYIGAIESISSAGDNSDNSKGHSHMHICTYTLANRILHLFFDMFKCRSAIQCVKSAETHSHGEKFHYEHAQNHVLLDKREMFCVPLLLFLLLLLKNIASASTWHSALASAVRIPTAQHSTRVQHGIQYDFCIAKGQYAWKFECKNFTLAVHRKWCAKKHKPSEVQVVNCNVYASCLNLEAKKYREKRW